MEKPSNAEIIRSLSTRWSEWEECGIGPDGESINEAAALGMVIEVWRNSPLENMHSGKRGPSDGEMFAESVALQRLAREVLESSERYGILRFGHHILDRDRLWAGGERTLQEMGFGYLGEFHKHVMNRSHALIDLDEMYGREALLTYLVHKADVFGWRLKGMPLWPRTVSIACDMIADTGHPVWYGQGMEDMASAPRELIPLMEEIKSVLLRAPDELPLAVLEWLPWGGPLNRAASEARRERNNGLAS
jgi:hypothetical protein